VKFNHTPVTREEGGKASGRKPGGHKMRREEEKRKARDQIENQDI